MWVPCPCFGDMRIVGVVVWGRSCPTRGVEVYGVVFWGGKGMAGWRDGGVGGCGVGRWKGLGACQWRVLGRDGDAPLFLVPLLWTA
jgi:hypothetical protein